MCSKSSRQVPAVRLAHTCVYGVSSPQRAPQGNFRASLSVSKLLPPSLGQLPITLSSGEKTSFLSPAAADGLPAPPGPPLLACCLCPREGPGVASPGLGRKTPRLIQGIPAGPNMDKFPAHSLEVLAPRTTAHPSQLPEIREQWASCRTRRPQEPWLPSRAQSPRRASTARNPALGAGCPRLGPSPRVRLSFLWPRQASSLSAGPGADQSPALAARGLLSRAPEHGQSSPLARLSLTASLPHDRERQGRTAPSLRPASRVLESPVEMGLHRNRPSKAHLPSRSQETLCFPPKPGHPQPPALCREEGEGMSSAGDLEWP